MISRAVGDHLDISSIWIAVRDHLLRPCLDPDAVPDEPVVLFEKTKKENEKKTRHIITVVEGHPFLLHAC